MSRWTSLALAAVVAAVLVTPVQAQEVEIKPAAKVKKDKYVITAEEIAERQDLTTAYDAVKLLRPNFLKATRAKGGITGSYTSEGYRPDVIGRPPASSGGSSTGSTGSSGEPAAGGGGARPRSDEGGTSAYGGSGVTSMSTAVLYINETRQRGKLEDDLGSVRASEVFEIRYMTGNEATGRYGSEHEGGAILLKKKGLSKP